MEWTQEHQFYRFDAHMLPGTILGLHSIRHTFALLRRSVDLGVVGVAFNKDIFCGFRSCGVISLKLWFIFKRGAGGVSGLVSSSQQSS